MKTRLILVLTFIMILATLTAVNQGQSQPVLDTPVAVAGAGRPWAQPTPASGRSAEVVIEISDLGAAVADVRHLAAQFGGQVLQSDRDTHGARLLLTLPVTQFEAAVARVHGLNGTVTHEALGAPLTLQDLALLQAQIDVLTTTDSKLRGFLAAAQTPEAVLKLETQLLVVQQELMAVRSALAQQQLIASTVTLEVTLQATAPATVQADSVSQTTGDPLEAVTFALMALVSLLAVGVALMFGRLAAQRALAAR